MRTVALEYLVADLALGILDEKPPLRPLAPPATSRASQRSTRLPACASLSAAVQPVTPAPTTTTSAAPSSLTAGTDETLSVNWQGLETGTYLGLITHTDGATVLDQTVIEITAP